MAESGCWFKKILDNTKLMQYNVFTKYGQIGEYNGYQRFERRNFE